MKEIFQTILNRILWKMKSHLVEEKLVLVKILFYLISSIQVRSADGDATKNLANYIVKQEQEAIYNYGVVVNCGSSGSRAHIYRWPITSDLDNLAFFIEPARDSTSGEVLRKSIRPGLSSFKDNPDAASDYMRPLMDFIASHIPIEFQSKTPIYFLATAGLRLLTETQQRLLLDDISRDLRIEYNFPLINATVISGVQEGIYQWISVNAYTRRLNRTFDLKSNADFYCQSPISRSFGIMEIGGASAQVAYEITPKINQLVTRSLKHSPQARAVFEESQNEFKISQNRTIRVFSTTFLGLGSNSIRELAIDLLVRDAIKVPFNEHQIFHTFYDPPINIVLFDPCLPVGSEESVRKPIDIVYNRTSTIGYTPKVGTIDNIVVSLVGKGNFHQCQHLLNRLIVLSKREKLNCNPRDKGLCSSSLLATNFIPFKHYQFLGFGELFYTTKEMLYADGQFNFHLVLQKTIEICSTPYEVLLAKYPEANRQDSKRILLECFKASWILVWLYAGVNLSHNHIIDLTTLNKINGDDVEWSLGALIVSLSNQADRLKGVGFSNKTS